MHTEEMRIITPLGILIAYPSNDEKHPGIFIDIIRDDYEFPVALIGLNGEGNNRLITHVWKDIKQEDYSNRITHTEDGYGIN